MAEQRLRDLAGLLLHPAMMHVQDCLIFNKKFVGLSCRLPGDAASLHADQPQSEYNSEHAASSRAGTQVFQSEHLPKIY